MVISDCMTGVGSTAVGFTEVLINNFSPSDFRVCYFVATGNFEFHTKYEILQDMHRHIWCVMTAAINSIIAWRWVMGAAIAMATLACDLPAGVELVCWTSMSCSVTSICVFIPYANDVCATWDDDWSVARYNLVIMQSAYIIVAFL